MEHMKEMDWEAILEQEDMNREGFEYIDEDEEESVEHLFKLSTRKSHSFTYGKALRTMRH